VLCELIIVILHSFIHFALRPGLIALCPDSNNTVLACPGLKPGYVHLRLNDINVHVLRTR
jgi:hypothetical protein